MQKVITEDKMKRFESSLIRAFWGICGYFFVGFISLIYGLTLQVYNSGKMEFVDIFLNSTQFRNMYTLIILIMLIFNVIFCHAYASLYFQTTHVEDRRLYPKIGHWLETFLVIVVMVYVIPVVYLYKKSFYMLLIIGIISIPWGISIGLYRTFLIYKKKENDKICLRIKYKLIIPSMLMVASNIYIGSCLKELLNGELEYYCMFIPLLGFIVMYELIDFYLYIVNRRQNETNGCFFEKNVPYIFFGFLLVVALISFVAKRYWGIMLYDIPIRSMFLASFVAVYLGMFEGMFIIRDENPEDLTSNKRIKDGISNVLNYMPMIVFLLFPFQEFQITFFFSFLLGHLYTRWYWNKYQNRSDKKPKDLAIARARLGSLTLLALIMDKWYPINVTDTLSRIMNMDFLVGFDKIEVWIAIGGLIISICTFNKDSIRKNEKISGIQYIKNIFGQNRITIYAVLSSIITVCYIFFDDMEPLRIFLSVCGCIVLIIYEMIDSPLKTNNLSDEGVNNV